MTGAFFLAPILGPPFLLCMMAYGSGGDFRSCSLGAFNEAGEFWDTSFFSFMDNGELSWFQADLASITEYYNEYGFG